MEKGEIAAFGASFGMLVALVFFLNLTTSGTTLGPSTIETAFWGAPDLNQRIMHGNTLVAPSNESLIYVRFSLGAGGIITAASASRVCQDPLGGAGEIRNYGNLTFEASSGSNEYYLIISPTTQTSGWQCAYTATVSLNTKVVFQWTGTVKVQQ